MGDNQIVINIVDNFDQILNVNVGDRYIIKNEDYSNIVEYDGNKWNKININACPINIFITDTNETVIYYNNKVWKQNKWFICMDCKKVTLCRMKKSIDVNEYCEHCYFKVMHSEEKLKKSSEIEKYIHKYSKIHYSYNCDHTKDCYLCDYNNNKFIKELCNNPAIYGKNIIDNVKKLQFDMCI